MKVTQKFNGTSLKDRLTGLWDVGNLVIRTQRFNVLQHAWFPVAGIFCAYSNATRLGEYPQTRTIYHIISKTKTKKTFNTTENYA